MQRVLLVRRVATHLHPPIIRVRVAEGSESRRALGAGRKIESQLIVLGRYLPLNSCTCC